MFALSHIDDDQQNALNGVLLEALLHDTTLAVAASDAEGTVALMSPALEAMIRSDYAPVRAENIPAHFRVYTEDGSRLLTPEEEPLNRACSGESFRSAVVSLRTHDRHFIHLRCSGAPLRDANGIIQGGLVIFEDVTAERAVLREQTALRDRLVETVNHQLRTPLTSLLGHAELLEDLIPELPYWAVRSLRSVIASADRLNDLVRSVSGLVDIDAAGTAVCVPVDLVPLVRTCIDRTEEPATERDVEVVLTSPDGLVAELDPAKVASAIRALLDNAIAHAPAHSQVEVAISSSSTHVRVEVADTGPGIPTSERERLLLPFERGTSELTAPTGRGLGLTVAHTVAVAHRGTLELEDNLPVGLRVSLEVPHSCGPSETT